MDRHATRYRFRPLGVFAGACVAAVVATAPLPAADLSPPLMARFTKQVQPLVLNKCASGACHGGPSGHAPHFLRGDLAGRIDRDVTLANIDTLLDTVAARGDLAGFLKVISSRHPASATSVHRSMAPLSTVERATLEQWLRTATASRGDVASRPAPPPASPAAAARGPNRFRALLDTAASPAPLPEPEPLKGIILGKDGE